MIDDLNDKKILDGFRFRETKHHFTFLGDYTDRGATASKCSTRCSGSRSPIRIRST